MLGGFLSDQFGEVEQFLWWHTDRLVIFVWRYHLVNSSFLSILLIIIGTGFQPNVSEMVGTLYSRGDLRRDSGFTIFVFGINLGSLVAPLLVGFIGQNYNYHAGFSLAAIGMFFGLVQYVMGGRKYLSKDSLYPNNPLEPGDAKRTTGYTVTGAIGFC